MEPVTLIAIFAAAFVVKLGEKAADVLGERAAERGDHLFSVLRQEAPDAAMAIERIAQRDELTGQDYVNLGVAQLVGRVEQLAQTNAEVKAAIDTTAEAVQQQPGEVPSAIVNLGKIAVLNQGTIVGQTNNVTI